METPFISVEDAIEVVRELARQAMLTEEQCGQDEALLKERQRQLSAITTIEDFFTNVVFG